MIPQGPVGPRIDVGAKQVGSDAEQELLRVKMNEAVSKNPPSLKHDKSIELTPEDAMTLELATVKKRAAALEMHLLTIELNKARDRFALASKNETAILTSIVRNYKLSSVNIVKLDGNKLLVK